MDEQRLLAKQGYSTVYEERLPFDDFVVIYSYSAQDAGNVSANWQTINHQFVRQNRQQPGDSTEIKLRIGGSEVTIWVGCELFRIDDSMPKLTFYLPEEH